MFWEYSPNSVNIASDWLKAESSPADEEEIKMDDGVDTSHTSEGTDPFVDLSPTFVDPFVDLSLLVLRDKAAPSAQPCL